MTIRIAVFCLPLLLVNLTAGQEAYAPSTVLPFAIRAIEAPDFVPASEAELDDGELVIGVEIEGKSRAYPINQLTGPHREIINDTLAGTAIAATW